MQSMIEEIFYGNIRPNESSFNKESNYHAAMKIVAANEENLLGLLEEPERKIFLEYINAQSEIIALTAIEKFSYGFRLGAALSAEIFTSLNDLTVDH